MTRIDLPQELYDLIVDFIGYNNKKTLIACSIAYRKFTQPCQRHLFHRVSFHIPNSHPRSPFPRARGSTTSSTTITDTPPPPPPNPKEGRNYWLNRCRTLEHIFTHNPPIMHHIRRFKIVQTCGKSFGDFPEMTVSRAIAGLLTWLSEMDNPRLESVKIQCHSSMAVEWADIPSPIQLAVYRTRNCRSMVNLEMKHVRAIPVLVLETWANLKSLTLTHSFLIEPIKPSVASSGDVDDTTSIITSTNAASEGEPGVQPVVLQLDHLFIYHPFSSVLQLHADGYLRKALSRLRTLHITVMPGTPPQPFLDLIFGTSRTLTKLNLCFKSDAYAATIECIGLTIDFVDFRCLEDLKFTLIVDEPAHQRLADCEHEYTQLVTLSKSPTRPIIPLKIFAMAIEFCNPIYNAQDMLERYTNVCGRMEHLNEMFTPTAVPLLTDFTLSLGFRTSERHLPRGFLEATSGPVKRATRKKFPNVSHLAGFAVKINIDYGERRS